MTQANMPREGRVRFHLLNAILGLAALMLGVQSLLAKSVSAGWDLGLLLPLMMAAALLFWLAVRLIRRGRAIQGLLPRRIVLALVAVGIAVFVLIQGLLVLEPFRYGARQLEVRGAKTDNLFVIVLGCGIKPDGTPTWALANRLDAALDWYRTHDGTRLVVSGGQGTREPTSEAAVHGAISACEGGACLGYPHGGSLHKHHGKLPVLHPHSCGCGMARRACSVCDKRFPSFSRAHAGGDAMIWRHMACRHRLRR